MVSFGLCATIGPPKRDLAEPSSAHRAVRDRREAYRLNTIILVGQGRSDNVALLLDPETVRSISKRYQKGSVDELPHMSDALLTQCRATVPSRSA